MTKVVNIIKVRTSGFVVDFLCDYCGQMSAERQSHFNRKKRHYCDKDCYSFDRQQNWSKSEQPTWRGGVSNTEAHRRWKKKNPKRMAHLKAMRYAREKNAKGSYSLEGWETLCQKHDFKCVSCGEKKKLTKDHIIPLSKGGSNYIDNIQPMCRNCNSKKYNHIYENPELLEQTK